MLDVLTNLVTLLVAAWDLVLSVLLLVLPWTPLVAWLGFWLFAVDWVKLRAVLLQGGCVGLFAIGFMAILIWGVVAPPETGMHHILGLTVSNFVGKTVYVTALITIMLLCGAVQLSGACGSWACFPEPEPEDEHHGHARDHGHDNGHAPAVAVHGHH